MTKRRLHPASAAMLAVALVTPLSAGAATPAASATPSEHSAPAGGSSMRVTGLEVDGMTDPIGTEVTKPSLSWRLESRRTGTAQTSYEVEVASSSAALRAGRADLWDTGRVGGTEQTVTYDGDELASRQRAWWRVRAWDERGHVSRWSEPAHWELGLLEPADWTAQWIKHPGAETKRMPVFARRFDLPGKVQSARLYAAGLGVYVAELNGQKVGETVLDPPNTDFADRVVYGTYDVTPLLRRGDNVLGMRLGNGIYNVPQTPGRYQKLAESFGPPKLIAQLEVTLADGREIVVDSDGSWRTTLGATTFSGWYGGEDYDAREVPVDWGRPDADLGSWPAVEMTAAPSEDTELSARFGPGIEPVDRIRAKSVTHPAPNVHVFDLGTNIAGWPELKVDVPAGTAIQMWPSEWLTADGRVDQRTTRGPIWDTYTSAGDGPVSWHPEFSYHGFRYIEVRGLPDGEMPSLDTVTGIVLRAANDDAGSFDSSHALLNGIHRIIDRAVQGNMYSVLTDCPHREKLGWLEETHLVWETVSRGYDVSAYGRDLTRNMADAQTADGLVPDIAPEYTVFEGGFRDDPNWGSAIIQVPWRMYQSYADTGILRPYYEDMKEYLAYLEGRSEDNLLDYGLGDWIAFDESTPVGVTASFGYHEAARSMSRIAEVLGEDADATRFRQLTEDIGAAFHEKYYDEERGTYASGSQASDALALDMGIVPDSERQRVLDHLLASIEAEDYHFTVGEIALPSIIGVLHESGNDETMYRVATQTSNPSYGYQVVNGATSLTETWDGPTAGFSQNHFMLGAIDEWFSTALAGIGQRRGTVGYRDLEIAPSVVGDLASAEAEYRTPYGKVSSSWQRHGYTFELDVEVPVGSTARVRVPVFGDVDDPRYHPRGSHGSRFLGIENGHGVFEIGSGRWDFTARLPERAPDPQPFVAIDAPSEVAVYDGQPNDFAVTLRNLEDERVTVEPTASGSAGWSASVRQPRVRIPAHGTATVRVDVATDSAQQPPGTVTVEVAGRQTEISVSNTENAARVATMSASSTYGHFSAAKTNDGDTTPMTDFARWDAGNGWNDDTLSEFPDTLTATWSRPQQVSRVELYTLDAANFPASRYGVRDYDLEALVDDTWITVASVRGNTAGVRESTFDPVTTDALRLEVLDSNSHDYSRVVELKAHR